MKICSKCKEEKELSKFAKRSKSSDGHSSWCKECFKKYDKLRYLNGDKVRKKENSSKYIWRNRIEVWSYLTQHPCVDCGETDILVLQFDHLPEFTKVKDVSILVSEGSSLRRLYEEIAKCEVVCANDHSRRTAKRAEYAKYVVQKYSGFESLRDMYKDI